MRTLWDRIVAWFVKPDPHEQEYSWLDKQDGLGR